jgi:hypothetical protein
MSNFDPAPFLQVGRETTELADHIRTMWPVKGAGSPLAGKPDHDTAGILHPLAGFLKCRLEGLPEIGQVSEKPGVTMRYLTSRDNALLVATKRLRTAFAEICRAMGLSDFWNGKDWHPSRVKPVDPKMLDTLEWAANSIIGLLQQTANDANGVSPLDNVLAVLTPKQGRIWKHLRQKKMATYQELKDIQGAWQASPTDDAVSKALTRMKESIERANLQGIGYITISEAKKLVTLT